MKEKDVLKSKGGEKETFGQSANSSQKAKERKTPCRERPSSRGSAPSYLPRKPRKKKGGSTRGGFYSTGLNLKEGGRCYTRPGTPARVSALSEHVVVPGGGEESDNWKGDKTSAVGWQEYQPAPGVIAGYKVPG